MSAKEDAVDYELLKSLGLSMESFGATEGKQAADHFDEIIDKLEDIEFSKATRIEMASMLGNWHSLASDENKTALYTSGKAIRIFEAAKILIPTSDDVKIAEAIVSGSSTYLIMTDFNQTMAPYVVATLRAAMGLSIAASKPLKEDGESQFRANCVSGLLSCLPYTGIRDASKMPEDTVDIIASFISYEPTCQSVQAAGLSALSLLAMNNSDLFNGHLGGIFKALRVYPAASSILGQIQNGFEADPQSYKENLEIFFDMGLQTTFSIIQQISTQDASALAPYVERIRDIALTDQLYGSSAMTWLKNIAQADETGSILSLTLVESLYDSAFTGNGAEYTYAMLVGACRKEPDRTIRLLVRMLQDKRLIGQASSVILNEINNLKEDSSGPDFFREFMDTIMSFAPTNAALVQQIEDWAEGRTLEILDKRVDAVEARIDELNQRVQESCQNFEEVMLYMDEHIEDLKEFVATVVKKLPSPIRLTVVGGLKKTIKLHFPCCRQHPPCQSPYGSEFTVETREWNKWLKIGFNVAKLGKCVIDIGLGNPLGLARTGIDAVSDIYEAYKKEDDEEFNNYITNPFLSNKEQDKLLEQLRGEAFFDAFEYDAQLAGWYCGLCASIPGQAVKMIEMEEEGLTGYGSTTKEKGEGRFGLNLTLEDGFKLGEKIVELVTGDEEEDGGGKHKTAEVCD